MELEVAAALVTVFILAVTILTARSYTKTKSRKVLIVTCAFALFFVKAVLMSYGLMQEDVAWEDLVLTALVLDALVALLLFAAIVTTKGGK